MLHRIDFGATFGGLIHRWRLLRWMVCCLKSALDKVEAREMTHVAAAEDMHALGIPVHHTHVHTPVGCRMRKEVVARNELVGA